MFDDPQIKALCSDEHVAPQESNATVAGSGNVEHKRLLREFGLSASLVECGEAERNKFLTKQADLISEKLAARETRPIVVSIYLDVFGFSRGAAQARVFVNWLNRLAMHGQARLFGLPSFIRLLGLFDTVASVGFSDVVGGDGHWGWASTADLRIPPSPVVQNCVHYVALHERRLSFPLDSVCRHDSLPSNCHELICPGAHSDLGGGYLPGEQGKGVFTPAGRPEGNPAARLSQHYLNAMYAAALRTCVAHGPESSPWLKKGQKQNDGRDMEEQFACAPHVPNMVEKYFAQCGISAALPVETAVQEHGMLYLAWRYQITQAQGFENLASVHYAKDTDPTGLHAYRQGQEVLAAQLERMKFDLLKWLRNAKPSGSDHPAVGQIFVRLPKVQVPAEVGWFYDHLVHDSSASFLGMLKDNMTTFLLIESQRYLRYRTVYKGDGHGRNAQPLTNYDPNTGAALPARKKLA